MGFCRSRIALRVLKKQGSFQGPFKGSFKGLGFYRVYGSMYHCSICMYVYIWVVVKIMVPFWVLIIIRHLLFGVPQRGPNFDNHPYRFWARGRTFEA